MLVNVPVFWVKTQCSLYRGTSVSEDLFYLEDAGYKILGKLVPIHQFTWHHITE